MLMQNKDYEYDEILKQLHNAQLELTVLIAKSRNKKLLQAYWNYITALVNTLHYIRTNEKLP